MEKGVEKHQPDEMIGYLKETTKRRGSNVNVTSKPTHKGVNQRSKYVTQVQQQRPELPTATLTWHAVVVVVAGNTGCTDSARESTVETDSGKKSLAVSGT